ncbi:metallophosphoesterase family protein [soil metagenome]
MERRFVVSDIHGCAKTFNELLFNQLHIEEIDSLYLLGDYVDRGPDSKGVLDIIIELSENKYKVFPLRGNHEQFMFNSFLGPKLHQFWLECGGHQTLQSFKAATIFDIPSQYIDFLESLVYYIELEDFLLVHAGFNFSEGKPFQDLEAMMMIRNYKVDRRYIGNKKIIHGHTPIPLYEIKKNLKDEDLMAINLDAGCVYKNTFGLGNLLALDLDTWNFYIQPCLD